MVTQVTPPVNEELIEYHRLYSEYVSMFIEIHNYNVKFLKFEKVRDYHVITMRRLYRKMKFLQSKLSKAATAADKKHWQLNPKSVGRPEDPGSANYIRRHKKKKKDVDIPGSNSGRVTR